MHAGNIAGIPQRQNKSFAPASHSSPNASSITQIKSTPHRSRHGRKKNDRRITKVFSGPSLDLGAPLPAARTGGGRSRRPHRGAPRKTLNASWAWPWGSSPWAPFSGTGSPTAPPRSGTHGWDAGNGQSERLLAQIATYQHTKLDPLTEDNPGNFRLRPNRIAPAIERFPVGPDRSLIDVNETG